MRQARRTAAGNDMATNRLGRGEGPRRHGSFMRMRAFLGGSGGQGG